MDKIDKVFPMDKYRPGQKEAIETILNAFEDHDFVLLEAPTGSGKSAIGYTIMQLFDNSFYLAPQKFLQDQLARDFGQGGKHIGSFPPMIELKGRNAYPCEIYHHATNDSEYLFKNSTTEDRYFLQAKKDIRCDCGECKIQGKSKLDYCMQKSICPYFNRLHLAQSSKHCLMNYHSFLFQTMSDTFDSRSLLVLDESHNTEDILMGFVELTLSDRYFQRDGIIFDKKDTVEEYIKYFENINLLELMDQKRKIALATNNFKEHDVWISAIRNYEYLINSNPNNWVPQWEEVKSGASRKITIKPIFIDQFAKKYLFRYAKKTLMLSATLLSGNVVCDNLGIDRDNAKFFKLPNLFPVENRRILYKPSGSMKYKSKATTMPRMIADIEKICNKHKNERGIIHTHTFAITNKLIEDCKDSVSSRFVFQRAVEFNNDKEKLLIKHRKISNSIIVAPAMHEGLDLYNDLGRFQIICKVPYPSITDPQISARLQISQTYYNWLTMCKLVQSTGRIIRHDEDYGVTYILDSDFKQFCERSGNLMPKWFKAAIKW